MSATFEISGRKAIIDYLAARSFKASLHGADMAELPTGDGYYAGGVPLNNPRTGNGIAEDGSQYTFLTWDNPSWSNASFSGARYLRIYDGGTGSVSSTDGQEPVPPISYGIIDFGAEKNAQGADFTYKFPATGGVIRI